MYTYSKYVFDSVFDVTFEIHTVAKKEARISFIDLCSLIGMPSCVKLIWVCVCSLWQHPY